MSAADIAQEIRQDIQNLEQLAYKLQLSDRIDEKLLEEIITESNTLLRVLQRRVNDKDTEDFMAGMIAVLWQLQHASREESEKRLPKNFFCYSITAGFEKYIKSMIPRKALNGMRAMTDYIPFMKDAIVPCEILPFSWDYCKNNKERIAISVLATLFLVGIGLTIAVYASPAVAAVPFIGLGIFVFCAVVKFLFQQVSVGPLRRYEERNKINELGMRVDKQINTINSLIEKYYTRPDVKLKMPKEFLDELSSKLLVGKAKEPVEEKRTDVKIGIKPPPVLTSEDARGIKRRSADRDENQILNFLPKAQIDKKRR